jgi:hypothetical protein
MDVQVAEQDLLLRRDPEVQSCLVLALAAQRDLTGIACRGGDHPPVLGLSEPAEGGQQTHRQQGEKGEDQNDDEPAHSSPPGETPC